MITCITLQYGFKIQIHLLFILFKQVSQKQCLNREKLFTFLYCSSSPFLH